MKNINRKGFSLIELLIAMAILAGLATMALPNLDLATDNVKKTEMQNDARNTISLIDSYHAVEMELPDRQTLKNGDFLGNNEVKINEESVIYYELNNDCINGYEILLERTNVDKNVYYNFCYGKVEVVEKPPRLALIVKKPVSGGVGSFDIEELSKNDYEAVLSALSHFRNTFTKTENMDDEEWKDYLENELLAKSGISFSFENDQYGDSVRIYKTGWYSVPNSSRNVFVNGTSKYINGGIDYLNQ